MNKPKVLLIKSLYKGVGEHIGNLVRDHKERVDFLTLKYKGNAHMSDTLWLQEVYNPDDFSIGRNQKDDSQEVSSKRLTNVIDALDSEKYKGYSFRKSGTGLELVASDSFNSTNFKSMHRAGIERLASLIYNETDAVLPIWFKGVHGVGYQFAIENMYQFLDAIKSQKPNLFVAKDDILTQTPTSALAAYLWKVK